MAEWTKDDVIELLVGIIAGGRGGGGLPPGPDLATEMITGSGRPPIRNRGSKRGSVSRKFAMPQASRSSKKPRKVSAYQREFGRQLKKLKKKHPRTPVTKLMKRAHSATKKARRGK